MDYTQFKTFVFELIGIDLNQYKEGQMKRRIDSIVKKNNCKDYKEYSHLIKKDSDKFSEFVNHLTINVSEFFRNAGQWEILEKEIFPTLLSRKRPIKIWSAACSTGEEPYSLAMTLSKLLPLNQINIIATDIDQEVLRKAKIGQYTLKDVANIPKEFRDKYFETDGVTYTVKPELKKCITFKQHNLLEDNYPEQIDLIVCRNVLIYFTIEAKDTIFMKFGKSLVQEGILFVGSTEQIMVPTKYDLGLYRTFFYQKK